MLVAIIGGYQRNIMCFKKWRFSKDFLHPSQKWRFFQAGGKWRYKNGADNKEIILYNIIKGAMKKVPEMAPQGIPFGSLINCAATYISSPAPVSSSYCES